MTLPRFYCPVEISPGQTIDLPESIGHHAARVLRLEHGAGLILFNGRGGEFRSVITRIGRNSATVVAEKHLAIERESQLSITLAQAICGSEKMDWIVQKAVELGVNRIQPLATKRSIVRLSVERGEKRLDHLRKVVISACEQCGRNRIPEVSQPARLQNWLGQQIISPTNLAGDPPVDSYFVLSPAAKEGLRYYSLTSRVTAITLLVGPEGGFAPEEEAAAVLAGFLPLRLGPRILRAESAALAAVAAMQALWGDY
ncbi:16S rRNA (uracil(1498)-N(3))-methyltransferase [Nitrosospira sp. Is2]|uniref:16S rRNA (uracil(1498)-N(3))-methyltransferase n=1 Tax=Nitrosospira sp. Is2 TaxID=3080532 RepID=UPI0029541ECA|nr:16S rRNA (uracil(1498)-N(3))-methyltransferase [Nitrosospira sp. Is2]WON74965.1 16S rRNA (uracil(1498)-N(3))-methyltransferase [Nitrosospira sp. Is2]